MSSLDDLFGDSKPSIRFQYKKKKKYKKKKIKSGKRTSLVQRDKKLDDDIFSFAVATKRTPRISQAVKLKKPKPTKKSTSTTGIKKGSRFKKGAHRKNGTGTRREREIKKTKKNRFSDKSVSKDRTNCEEVKSLKRKIGSSQLLLSSELKPDPPRKIRKFNDVSESRMKNVRTNSVGVKRRGSNSSTGSVESNKSSMSVSSHTKFQTGKMAKMGRKKIDIDDIAINKKKRQGTRRRKTKMKLKLKKKRRGKKKKGNLFSRSPFDYSGESSDEERTPQSSVSVYSPFEPFKKEEIFTHSKKQPGRKQTFLSSQEIEDLGVTQVRIDTLNYCLDGLSPKNSASERISCINKLTKMVKSGGDEFMEFTRSHSVIKSIFSVLTQILMSDEKKEVEEEMKKGLYKVLSLQILCHLLQDEVNCKFITFDTFNALFECVKIHPYLQSSGGYVKSPFRAVRKRMSRHKIDESPKFDKEKNEKIVNSKKRAVSLVLETLVYVIQRVPYLLKLIQKVNVENTIEEVIGVFVMLVQNNLEDDTVKDLNNSLKVLKFSSFDFSVDLHTVIPSLVSLLNTFASTSKDFIFQLHTDNPKVECIFQILNLLTNLTNKNRKASNAVAYESGILSCLKILGSNLGQNRKLYSPPGSHFDITANILGLFINLTEENKENRSLLRKNKIKFPDGSEKKFFNWLLEVFKLREKDEENMENKILGAYSCLLVGCCIKEHESNQRKVLTLLKKEYIQLEEMITVLNEFLLFKKRASLLTKEVLEGVNEIKTIFEKCKETIKNM